MNESQEISEGFLSSMAQLTSQLQKVGAEFDALSMRIRELQHVLVFQLGPLLVSGAESRETPSP